MMDGTRRAVLKGAGALGSGAALAALGGWPALEALAAAGRKMGTRPIPSTGERLPMVGVGTARVFNERLDAESRARFGGVLRALVAAGGSAIDTSPMYGRSEGVAGTLVHELGLRDKVFIATKVWTDGREAGIRQMRRSLRLFHTDRIELMQIHNLSDWRTQLKTLYDWKARGVFKYIGITHYTARAFGEVADILKRERLDFVQVPYSIRNRAAERTLFPVCRDRGVAVITHRNFERGWLFSSVRGRPLPPWAAEADIASWGQFFLKWVLSHPAHTLVIPGTSKVRHMVDNVQAGMGRLPDARMRQRMVRYIAEL